MDKKRAVELLIQAIEEIPRLKTLHYDNDEFQLWRSKVEDIIRAGLDQDDYSKYSSSNQSLKTLRGIYDDSIYQKEYHEEIIQYEIALKSIIQKYEILGIAGEGDKGGKVEKMEKKEAIQFLEEKLVETIHLRELHYDNEEYELWVSGIEVVLKTALGDEDFKVFHDAYPKSFPMRGVATESQLQEHYQKELNYRETAIKKILQNYEILGIEEKPTVIEVPPEDVLRVVPPKAFIAHGGQSLILDKLKDFLKALGIEPLVVEEQASENRSVGDNVDYYARQADFAIILATKGDIDGTSGGFIPRGNVLMEIGKSQEIFKDRIIYLLQAGTKFPTNVSEKVWGRFTTERMDDAFIKIARELTGFGMLKAEKPPIKEHPH